MINKSFGLKENLYSRQVLTILSIPWKLPLKGYSIVVIISYFFFIVRSGIIAEVKQNMVVRHLCVTTVMLY